MHESDNIFGCGCNQRGFTIVEMMVVVAILALLAALAAPSFTPVMERWRVRQAVEALQSTLYVARSEAMKHGGSVFIQKNAQGTDGCTLAAGAADWGCGWFVYVDGNRNASFDGSGELLQLTPPVKGTEVSITPSATSIRLDRFGVFSPGGLRFTVSPRAGGVSSSATQMLCLAQAGRIRIVSGGSSCA